MQENCKKEICVCRWCKQELKPPNRTYCTWKCRVDHGVVLRTYTCANCNINFTTSSDNMRKKINIVNCCSSKCVIGYYSGERNKSWKGIKEERKCLTCSSSFFVRKSQEKTKLYCTRVCKNKRDHIKPTISGTCEYCKSDFTKPKITGGYKYCGKKCASKAHGVKIRDVNNPNYLHGNGRGNYPVEWNKNFKNLIRNRDEYKCQICSMSEEEHNQKLCVHHIDFDKFNLSPENLITLCKWCHGKFHGKYTREKCKNELLSLLKEKNKSLTMSIT